jgi:hypothetical protein
MNACSDESPTLTMAKSHFVNLIGIELDYYGCDAGGNTFKVDDIVFKILEDPSDGYRSMLGGIDYTDRHNSIFFNLPIGRVKICEYDEDKTTHEYIDTKNTGYRLVDVDDDHVWLEFGTHNYDDYYPMFIFRHMPKNPNR